MRLFHLPGIVIASVFCFCGYCVEPEKVVSSACETNAVSRSLYTLLEPYVPLGLIDGADDLRTVPVESRVEGDKTRYSVKIPIGSGNTQTFSFAVHTMPYNGTGTSCVLETDPISVQEGGDSLEIKPITIRIARDASNMLREIECAVPRLDILGNGEHVQLINGRCKLAVRDGKYGVQLYSLHTTVDEYNFVEGSKTKERAFLWGGDLKYEMTEENDTVTINMDMCADTIVADEVRVSAITTKFEVARLDTQSVAILQNIRRELYRLSLVQTSQDAMGMTAASAGFQALATIPAFLRRNLEVTFKGRGAIKYEQKEGEVRVQARAGLNTGNKLVIIDPLEFIRRLRASVHADFPKALLPPGENPGPFIQKEEAFHFDFTCTNGTATLNGAEIPVKLEDLMSNKAVQQVF